MNTKFFTASLLAVLVSLSSAYAQTPALSFTGNGGLAGAGSPRTIGYQFTVTNPISVSSLGIWDNNNNGLSESHMEGIFTAAGTLLASATIPSGTAAALLNGFRYVTIPSLILLPGTYDIGALYASSADLTAVDATGFSTDPNISLVGSRGTSSGFGNPTLPLGHDPGNFGSNFLLAAVPESGATLVLLAIGAGALMLTRGVKRTRSA
jgi:hypothetical protein